MPYPSCPNCQRCPPVAARTNSAQLPDAHLRVRALQLVHADTGPDPECRHLSIRNRSIRRPMTCSRRDLQQRRHRPLAGLRALLASETAGEVVHASRRRVSQRRHVHVARRLAARALDLQPLESAVDGLIDRGGTALSARQRSTCAHSSFRTTSCRLGGLDPRLWRAALLTDAPASSSYPPT